MNKDFQVAADYAQDWAGAMSQFIASRDYSLGSVKH